MWNAYTSSSAKSSCLKLAYSAQYHFRILYVLLPRVVVASAFIFVYHFGQPDSFCVCSGNWTTWERGEGTSPGSNVLILRADYAVIESSSKPKAKTVCINKWNGYALSVHFDIRFEQITCESVVWSHHFNLVCWRRCDLCFVPTMGLILLIHSNYCVSQFNTASDLVGRSDHDDGCLVNSHSHISLVNSPFAHRSQHVDTKPLELAC